MLAKQYVFFYLFLLDSPSLLAVCWLLLLLFLPALYFCDDVPFTSFLCPALFGLLPPSSHDHMTKHRLLQTTHFPPFSVSDCVLRENLYCQIRPLMLDCYPVFVSCLTLGFLTKLFTGLCFCSVLASLLSAQIFLANTCTVFMDIRQLFFSYANIANKRGIKFAISLPTTGIENQIISSFSPSLSFKRNTQATSSTTI